MSRGAMHNYNLVTAKATDGTSKQILTSDFRNAELAISTAAATTGTVKVKGGVTTVDANNNTIIPDLTAARSQTNNWDYIEIVDLQDGSAIDGDTGVSFAGVADNRLFEININGLDYIATEQSSMSGGSVSASVKLFDNQ